MHACSVASVVSDSSASLPGSSVHGILQTIILEWHYQRNENQNHNEVPFHTSQNGCYQKVYKQEMLERVWRKGNPLTLLVGMQTSTAAMENSVEIPWKTGNRTVIWRSNPTAGHTHWGKQNWKRHVYPNVHRSTVIIARTWKLPRCPSAEEWIRKQWYIYTMEYYLDIKKNTFESVNEVEETGAYYAE